MPAIRRILLAVRDPDARQQPGVAKALQLAQAHGAALELFHALSTPVFSGLAPLTGESVEKLRERTEEHARLRLVRAVAAAKRPGVKVDCTVEWDYPPHEAVVRRARKTGADLIIAECHRGRRSPSWLMRLTDWELLRLSPVPVLLIKSGKPYDRPLALAAVDPMHLHDKPADLDVRVVHAARDFAQALRGSTHVLHAINPAPSGLVLGDPVISAAVLSLTIDELRQQARTRLKQFLADVQVPRSRAHVAEGDPGAALPRTARRLGAGIVVMGAVSRSALKRLFIGNTAERVLDAMPCDVLVIKPREFEDRVAREPRGLRVVRQPAFVQLTT
jgi:universal stress protein E